MPTFINQIDQATALVNQGLDWILQYAKVDKIKKYKNLITQRRMLKKIRNNSESNTAVVLYGQSQCGKSHMVSSLLSDDGKPMLVFDRMNNINYEFLTKINPQGSGEATGLITRFTTQIQSDLTSEYPVHIKLMSIKDIVLMLCDGYYRDLDNREPFKPEEINRLLESFRENKANSRQNYICEDEIGDIEEYFINTFSNDLYTALSQKDYFIELSLVIEYLPEDILIQALCMLWNNDRNLSNIFRQLFRASKSLDFASDAYISFGDLFNSKKTLLDISWLEPTDDDLNYKLKLRHKNKGNEFTVSNIEKAYLAAICAEVVFEVTPPDPKGNEKSRYLNTIMNNVDILDFPGARARGGILTTDGHASQLLRRGKVGYYFDKYSHERKISSLLFCWEPDIFDAKPMENVLRNWVDISIGKDATRRASYMRNLSVPPLFFIGTKFNKLLSSLTSDRDDNELALTERWNKWFNDELSKTIIGVPDKASSNDNYKWFESWTDSNTPFDNCYLLRDFRYSTQIFEGWDENGGTESGNRIEPYPGFYEKLKTSFLEHPFVKRHFKDAEQKWNEASVAQCDGSITIVRNLANIVEKITSATKEKNLQDVKESIEKTISELKADYYSTDSEQALKKALESAARLQASLDIAFGKDPYYFGHFMKSLTVTEYAVHQVVTSILTQTGNAGNIGAFVFIYTKAPDIKSTNSFEENLHILRRAYGFSSDDECKHFFENERGIDLNELFRCNDLGLKSPSQMIAAVLKDFWFNKWLRESQHDSLCDMLGERTYFELVNMLQSLFTKYKIENLIAQTIHNYVDTFGTNIQVLSEMIADICAEMINKFVLSVGYDYYSAIEGMVDKIKEDSEKHNINLNFDFVNQRQISASKEHIATLMDQMDDMERTRRMLENPAVHSINDLADVIPGFRQSCRWRDLAKIGFVISNDIPNYDINANERLGQIINSCITINQQL